MVIGKKSDIAHDSKEPAPFASWLNKYYNANKYLTFLFFKNFGTVDKTKYM